MKRIAALLLLTSIANIAAAGVARWQDIGLLPPPTNGDVALYTTSWNFDPPPVGTPADDSITNAKLANMVAATIKGRASGAGTGDPTDLTASQVITILLAADGASSLLDADLLDGLSSGAFQPIDSDLTAIAALTTTAFGIGLLDDADAAAARTTLGLGTLATQSGTFSGTSSGTNTGDQTTISGNAGTATALAANGANCSAGQAPLGVDASGAVETCTAYQASDGELTALAGLTSAADKLAYFTGSGTAALADFGSTLRTFFTTSSSANLRGVLTDESGSGVAYFQGGDAGTPSALVLTNATGVDAWRGTVFTTASLALTNAFADLTPASGPSLGFSGVAGATYRFYFYIWTIADATTTGIDCAINGPTIGAGSMTYQQRTFSSATAQSDNKATAYDTDTAQQNSQGAVNRIYVVAGIITLGATAGTVIARVKRENVGSGTAVSGSWVDWQRTL